MAKKKFSKNQIKYVVFILMLILGTVLSLYFILADNFDGIMAMIGDAKFGPVLAMFGLVTFNFIIEGTIVTLFAKLYRRKYHLYMGVLNGLVGSFFSGITPFASGGQFVQAYTFSKQGVKAANGASILVMMFIVSQAVLVIYGTCAIIFGYDSTIKLMNSINLFGIEFSPIALSIVGYVINFVSLGSLFLLSYCRPLHHFILNTGVNIGYKLHLIKDKDAKRASLAAQVATFRIELTRLFKNFWVLLIAIFLNVVKFTVSNSLPYFAGLALDIDMSGKYLSSVWSYSYVSMISCFVPIPGASGGAEAAFAAIYSSIFPNQTVTGSANILVRFFSFYYVLFIGLIVFIFYRGSPKKDATKFNKKTFVDLQIISLTSTDQLPILKKYEEGKNKLVDDINPDTFTNITVSDIKNEQRRKKKKSLHGFLYKDEFNNEIKQQEFLSSKQVQDSFNNIKDSLILDQHNIYEDIESNNTDILSQSKKNLSSIVFEVDKAKKEEGLSTETDTEVDRAIKEDLALLIKEEKIKQQKKKLRKERIKKFFSGHKGDKK